MEKPINSDNHYSVIGDIGGTKTWLALVPLTGADAWQMQSPRKCINADFVDLHALLTTYLQQTAPIGYRLSSMLLACAGPIKNQRCELTNHAWTIDATSLQRDFDLGQVILLNDFYAVAKGISLIDQTALMPLGAMAPAATGIKLVTGAGTGLGLAWLQCDLSECQAYATEGGHASFAPQGELQQALLAWYLQNNQSTACWETFLSGPGLERLYRFCAGVSDKVVLLSAAEIVAAAAQQDAIALAAIALFWELYAGWVSDLSLLFRPQAGIYLVGGVTQHLLPWLNPHDFTETMQSRGLMQQTVDTVPIVVVRNEQVGLLGALATLQDEFNQEKR
jgi:glucokinase